MHEMLRISAFQITMPKRVEQQTLPSSYLEATNNNKGLLYRSVAADAAGPDTPTYAPQKLASSVFSSLQTVTYVTYPKDFLHLPS